MLVIPGRTFNLARRFNLASSEAKAGSFFKNCSAVSIFPVLRRMKKGQMFMWSGRADTESFALVMNPSFLEPGEQLACISRGFFPFLFPKGLKPTLLINRRLNCRNSFRGGSAFRCADQLWRQEPSAACHEVCDFDREHFCRPHLLVQKLNDASKFLGN
jgi:hypothetical protein